MRGTDTKSKVPLNGLLTRDVESAIRISVGKYIGREECLWEKISVYLWAQPYFPNIRENAFQGLC